MSNFQDARSHRFSQLVGLELKANFARHEISQAEVAERLGHSKSGYSKWLNAKPSMPLEALLNTCELIGIDPREVINNAYARLLGEMGDAKTMSADEARVEETKRLLRENPMALAAYHDPDKQHYIDGDGIETA